MSKVRNLAEVVNTVLFMRHLVVVKLAQLVVVIPGKSRLSPPTMTQT